MTVRDLISELQKLSDEQMGMEVCDSCYEQIEEIKQVTWVHSNYPYNKPDKEMIMII